MPAFDPLPPLVTGQTYDLLFTINSSLLVLTWGPLYPPYAKESPFQSKLSDQVYPFLAAAQALDMEGEDCGVLKELIEEMFPQPAVQLL